MFKVTKNFFTNTLEFVSLKKQIRHLEKELEESKNKEKPYIDKINSLKSDNRVLKILNTKLEKKTMNLEQELEKIKSSTGNLFER